MMTFRRTIYKGLVFDLANNLKIAQKKKKAKKYRTRGRIIR
jgi:hypothetical protein